jgi:uncharacterized YigZ family protein
MLFDDTFQTIAHTSQGVFRDKGSKFIGYAYPIVDENEVKPILASLKVAHPKAHHFCWAMRLTSNRSIFKLNDDGEPSGTAGRPILNTLLSTDVTNLLVVVVRYFGGSLLGVPGLINAYKIAASEALKANEIIVKTINDAYIIHFEYLALNAVMRIVKEEQLLVLNQNFDSNCNLEFEVRKTNLNAVLSKLEKIEGIDIKYLRTIS